jgi:hypothetical protein
LQFVGLMVCPETLFEAPISHYRDWVQRVSCSRRCEKKELRKGREPTDATQGETQVRDDTPL